MTAIQLTLPDKSLLSKTGEVDYFYWNYKKFPINIIQKVQVQRILKLMGDKKHDSILEAGTGSGIFIPELSNTAINCRPLGYTFQFCTYPWNVQSLWDQNYNLSTQSIEQTNFPDKSFDLVVAVGVLEFVPDQQKAMTEIKRILKDGGSLLQFARWKVKYSTGFFRAYTSKAPKEEFGNARQKWQTCKRNFTVVKKGIHVAAYR